MKKAFLFFAIVIKCVFIDAQSVDSEKFEWVWQHSPLIKLTTNINSYTTNDNYLKIYDAPSQNDADIILRGGISPAVAIQSNEIKSLDGSVVPGYSQVYWVEAKTKDNKTVYYRIFNEFGEVSAAQPIVSGKPIKSSMFYFTDASRQVSTIFASFKNKEDFKLFYVKKSTSHDDINQAYTFARNAVRMFTSDSILQANQQLEEAVKIWNEALKQSNPKDKTARINKKVTEALYKNLISSLIMLNRFDEAQDLIKKSEKELGLFYSIFTSTQNYFLKKKRLSYLALSSTTPISLTDIDLPGNVSLITSASKLNSSQDMGTIKKTLAGSWRTVSITKDKLPAPTDTFVKSADPKKGCWHFLPNGKVYMEKEETNPSFNIDLSEYYWDAKRTTDGRAFFLIASSPEELKQKGPFLDFNPFEILHISLNTLLIKFENSNPNVDVNYFYYQLERIKPLLD